MLKKLLPFLLSLLALGSIAGAAPQWRHWVYPWDDEMSFSSVAFGNGIFVAVGETVVHSSDTVQWNEWSQTGSYVLHEVIFAEGRFVAVGRKNFPGGTEPPAPQIFSSLDGENWEAAVLPEIPGATYPVIELRSIAYREGTWIAVGREGAVLRSEDGVAWSVIGDVTDQDLTQVVATDDGFVIFGPDAIYGSPTGTEWSSSAVDLGESGDVSQAVFEEGRFLGIQNEEAWTSLDGVARLFSETRSTTGIGYADGLFVKLQANRLLLSKNLGDWGALDGQFSNSPRAVAASGDAIVIVTGDGSIYSMDGSWPALITVAPAVDQQVHVVGTQLLLTTEAVGGGTLEYQWSKDGVPMPGQTQPQLLIESLERSDAGDYTVTVSNEYGDATRECTVAVPPAHAPLPHAAYWDSTGQLPQQPDLLNYGNDRFVGVKNGAPTKVVHSKFGSGMWESGTFPLFQSFTKDRTFVRDRFFIGGIRASRSTPVLLSSPDGIVWEKVELPDGLNGPVFSVEFGNEMYLATGPGWVLRSEDGEVWEELAEISYLRSLTFGESYFLGSASEAIFRSEDGETWEEHSQPDSSLTSSLRFASGRWWLSDSKSGWRQSLDGKFWRPTGELEKVRDLISVNGVLVAIEEDGIR